MSIDEQPGPNFTFEPAEPAPATSPPVNTGPPRWVGLTGAALAGLLVGSVVMSGGPSDEELQAALVRADQAEVALDEAAEENQEQVADLEDEVSDAEAAMRAAEDKAEGAEAAALKTAEAKLAKRVADAEAKLAARAKGVGAKEAAVLEREKAVGTAEAEAAANTFPGDGIYVVGDDIRPGTYKSDGGSGCYWGRQTRSGDTIDNNIGDGPTVVTIEPSDFAIRVSRCAPFVRVS